MEEHESRCRVTNSYANMALFMLLIDEKGAPSVSCRAATYSANAPLKDILYYKHCLLRTKKPRSS